MPTRMRVMVSRAVYFNIDRSFQPDLAVQALEIGRAVVAICVDVDITGAEVSDECIRPCPLRIRQRVTTTVF